MKKYKFMLELFSTSTRVCNEEIIALEESLTESEVEQVLAEWVLDQIAISYMEV